ncbi:cbb3-type cytochrome c oxidase subunit I [Luteolibacter pohnpeiensis]|uniref:Cbb3-type cytochrome c oxidase subunit I n=1 Tax=Luteolibacter pohnpeiensis TaxID=454153 RepID=A0A934SDY4_9BACT|nr:cbb3-type cytochrome c oxidase subunit I [Luteolibacter pohnpeiensis]MBK1884352.1 cbb3-type cytochrome c oxidase subunit I [Luteolibacter pohnpeiensis]
MSSTTSNLKDAQIRAEIDRSLRHPVMFFMTSGAAWLAVSIVLAIISSAKVHSPGFLDGCPFLTYGRVFPAHMNALIYGWGFQAAFAAIIWLMARLSRQVCRSVGTILTAGHVWNFGVLLGMIGILSGHSTGVSWMEFPVFAWPVLLISYFIIVIWSFIQFRVRNADYVYISQWYLIAAMVWFPWVYLTANILIFVMTGHPVMDYAVDAWFKSALMFLFFVPVALGTAYYLAPKVTGKPIFSYSLAKLGFWSLAIIAPWAGLQKAVGTPIPYFLPYIGAAATTLLFLPALFNSVNLLQTTKQAKEIVSSSPTLRFTLAGIVGLLILGFSAILLNMPSSTLPLTQFSLSGYGFEILAIYGFFSFIMFGAIYFIVPRITRREWLSRRLISMHFFFSVYGIVFVALIAIFGGLQQGAGQEDWMHDWSSAALRARPYAVAITVAWSAILISNVFFFLHLTLMWLRLGRRSSHPTLLVSHESSSPHGAEGDIDNAGPASLPAHH